jgi:hypothetical protein
MKQSCSAPSGSPRMWPRLNDFVQPAASTSNQIPTGVQTGVSRVSAMHCCQSSSRNALGSAPVSHPIGSFAQAPAENCKVRVSPSVIHTAPSSHGELSGDGATSTSEASASV